MRFRVWMKIIKIGVDIFLTLEEAEKALKELKIWKPN